MRKLSMLSTYYVPMCLCTCPQLGPRTGKGERGVDPGGGGPRSHLPLHTHILSCTSLLSFLPFLVISLSSQSCFSFPFSLCPTLSL